MYPLTIHRLGAVLVLLLVVGLLVLLLGAFMALSVLAAHQGAWTSTGNVKSNRIINAMALLQTGQALVAGGHIINLSGKLTTIASGELCSPATDKWRYTGSLNAARDQHTVTLLPNWQVLVACGLDSTYQALAELSTPRHAHT